MDKVAHFQLQCCQHAFFLTQSFIDDTFLPLPLDDFAPGTVRLGERKKRRKGVNRSMDRMMDLCEKRRLKVPWTPRDHPNCRGYSLDDTRECDQMLHMLLMIEMRKSEIQPKSFHSCL